MLLKNNNQGSDRKTQGRKEDRISLFMFQQ